MALLPQQMLQRSTMGLVALYLCHSLSSRVIKLNLWLELLHMLTLRYSQWTFAVAHTLPL